MNEGKTTAEDAFDFAWEESNDRIDEAIEADLLSVKKKEVVAEAFGREPVINDPSAKDRAEMLAKHRETIRQMFQKAGRTTPLSTGEVVAISLLLLTTQEAGIKSALYHFFEKKNSENPTAVTSEISNSVSENITFAEKIIGAWLLEVNQQLLEISEKIELFGSTEDREIARAELVYKSKKLPVMLDLMVNMCKFQRIRVPITVQFLSDISDIIEKIKNIQLDGVISEYVYWFNNRVGEAKRNRETRCVILSGALFTIVRDTKGEVIVAGFVPSLNADEAGNPQTDVRAPNWFTAEDVQKITDCLVGLGGEVGSSFDLYFKLCKKYCQIEESGKGTKEDFDHVERQISPVGDTIRTQVIPKRYIELLLQTIQEHAKQIARIEAKR